MSHSIRKDPAFIGKLERALHQREQAKLRECVDRAFVRITTADIAAEEQDAKRRAEIARVFLAR